MGQHTRQQDEGCGRARSPPYSTSATSGPLPMSSLGDLFGRAAAADEYVPATWSDVGDLHSDERTSLCPSYRSSN